MKFLHAADVHLGYSQYGNSERYNDFARAYFGMVDAAISERVDFVLLAGDLFHHRDLDPRTLLQAARGLERLRAADIPVVAVEGNHERPRHQDGFSWVAYLAQSDLLINLSPWYNEDGMVLAPWDAQIRAGAYVDLPGGVRVYGCRYFGASTGRMIQDLAARMGEQQRPAYAILMLHAGVEGVLPQMGGMTHAQLAPLRPLVDYVALGHIHKPYEHDAWLHNPGSLETNSVQEADWPDRGYYLVEVDDTARKHHARLVRGQRRAFVRLKCNITDCGSPASVEQMVGDTLRREAAQSRLECPVVELTLTGTLAFAAAELPIEALRLCAETAYGALLVRVRNEAVPFGEIPADGDSKSRRELEREVLHMLIERDARWRENSEPWANAVLLVKEMALRRDAPERIIAEVTDLADQLLWEAE